MSLLKAEKPSVQPEPRLANSGSSRTANQPLKVPAHQVMGTTEVWETFHAQLRAFIGARVGDSADADDILQNVFVKIHTHIHTLRKQDRLATWVYQITRNAIIDSYRARHPHQSMPADLGAWDAPQESDPATQIGEYLRILVNGLAPNRGYSAHAASCANSYWIAAVSNSIVQGPCLITSQIRIAARNACQYEKAASCHCCAPCCCAGCRLARDFCTARGGATAARRRARPFARLYCCFPQQ